MGGIPDVWDPPPTRWGSRSQKGPGALALPGFQGQTRAGLGAPRNLGLKHRGPLWVTCLLLVLQTFFLTPSE